MKSKTWNDCIRAIEEEKERLEKSTEWIDRKERAEAFARVLSYLKRVKAENASKKSNGER